MDESELQWNEIGDENEREIAQAVYEQAKRCVPNADDPKFGEVQATVTVAFDENHRFMILANGTEEFRNPVQNTQMVLQEVLANFSEWVERVDEVQDRDG